MDSTTNKVTPGASPELITQAEHARRCGVSRKSVTIWKARRQLVMVGDLVDFEQSYKGDRWHASTKKVIGEMMTEGAPGTTVRAPAPRPASAPTPGRRPISRGQILAVLRSLDWSKPWTQERLTERRVQDAASLVGLEAVTSELRDDGHWGGFQLRDRAQWVPGAPLRHDDIWKGHGFELDASEALQLCRDWLVDPDDPDEEFDDVVLLRADLLELLAYPFHREHRPPADDRSPHEPGGT